MSDRCRERDGIRVLVAGLARMGIIMLIIRIVIRGVRLDLLLCLQELDGGPGYIGVSFVSITSVSISLLVVCSSLPG